MSLNKKELLQSIVDQVLKCYDETGLTIPEYQKRIKLPDLTSKEYEILKKGV